MFEVKYCIKFSKNKRASVKTCSFVCIFEVRLFIVRFLSDYFSAIIKTAMLTYRMRTDFCVALWALNQVGRAYLPVCSSCVLSLFRCFSFWYCHLTHLPLISLVTRQRDCCPRRFVFRNCNLLNLGCNRRWDKVPCNLPNI